jgi:hypothetical protein
MGAWVVQLSSIYALLGMSWRDVVKIKRMASLEVCQSLGWCLGASRACRKLEKVTRAASKGSSRGEAKSRIRIGSEYYSYIHITIQCIWKKYNTRHITGNVYIEYIITCESQVKLIISSTHYRTRLCSSLYTSSNKFITLIC